MSDPVTHQDAEFFIEAIAMELGRGYGFVPFIGAGFSAPSGAPLVKDLHKYLQRCICDTLIPRTSGDRPWEPRRDRWPSFTSPAREGAAENPFQQLLELYKEAVYTKNKDAPIFQEALGACAEWRSALLYLSRLVRYKGLDKATDRLALGPPHQEVIDECLRVAMAGRQPTLEHRMLAATAGLLRLETLLTTNFDTLLERAFESARNPLQSFDIPLGFGLPDWKAVSESRALIKLHGTRYGLRADTSLEKRPTELDLDHFLQYLLSETGRKSAAQVTPTIPYDFKNHLLILGFSAADQRIRDFIEYAWDHLDSKFKVFWVCFRTEDVANVKTFTSEYATTRKKQADWEGSYVLQHKHMGLLLLQLYQSLRQTLPPSGCIFPSISELSVPPMAVKATHQTDELENLPNRIKAFFNPEKEESKGSRIAAVWSKPDISGLTTLCGRIFRELQDEYACLWIDMNDVVGIDGLFETLLEAAYSRVGVEHWTPVYMTTDPRRRVLELARIARIANRPWVIFLNAREKPGANSFAGSDSPHGFLDNEKDAKEFGRLLKELCGYTETDRLNRNLSVVLLCRTIESQMVRTLTGGILQREFLVEFTRGQTNPSSRVDDALKDLSSNVERFLHTLALLQRPRFVSFLNWYSQIHPECDEGELRKLLTKLEDFAVVRWKPGGFLWFHSETREEIRKRLAQNIETAVIHRELALWYRRVLDASTTPAAAFEVVYHLLQAAREEKNSSVVAERDIREATVVLKTYGWMIQTHGYSKGSCRRLDAMKTAIDLVEIPKGSLVKIELKQICIEIMRAIAREVGEDATAYERTRQLRNLLTCGDENISSDSETFRSASIAKGAAGALAWVRWWRWNGMLGMASRSLQLGLRSLERSLAYLHDSGNQRENDPKVDISQIALDVWTAFGVEVQPSHYQAFRIESLRVLEQYIELHLVRWGAYNRLRTKPNSTEFDPLESKAIITASILAAKKLVGVVLANDVSVGSRDSTQAKWCLSRVLIHESALIDSEAQMGSQHAMRLLSEAEGCYQLADPSRFYSDLAMIELHRADAKLREASDFSLQAGTFGSLHFDLISTASAPYNSSLAASIEATRKIKSVLIEAIRFLDRAEPVLRERRRNIWWTGWYFERKMRSIALSITAAELEGFVGPIPFLGLESAPVGSPTEADTILLSTMRMIRVDAYRLATVLDGYASCALSLSRYRAARTIRDVRKTLELRNRQNEMRKLLVRGLDQLNEVLLRRPMLPSDATGINEDYFRMDRLVDSYISEAQNRCLSVVSNL